MSEEQRGGVWSRKPLETDKINQFLREEETRISKMNPTQTRPFIATISTTDGTVTTNQSVTTQVSEPSRKPTGDPRFHQVLKEMGELHDRKQSDYGRAEKNGVEADPFANVRASEDFGVNGVVGTLIRANDKIRRLQAWANGSELKNESVEDSLLDLANYAAIALVLWREQQNDGCCGGNCTCQ